MLISKEKAIRKEKIGISDTEIKDIVDEASSILNEYIIKQEKKILISQKSKKQDEMIEKAGEAKTEEIEEIPQEDVDDTFNFFIDMFLLVINPKLKKLGIESLQTQEVDDIKNALIDFLSPEMIEKGQKIADTIEGTKNLRKIYTLIKAIWKMIQPRISSIRKFFKSKKKEKV